MQHFKLRLAEDYFIDDQNINSKIQGVSMWPMWPRCLNETNVTANNSIWKLI